MPAQAHTIIGRADERKVVNTFIGSIERGPAIMVVEGESGIGKSVLWREGLEIARRRSFVVLECRPIQAEAQLAFTALGDLLDAVADGIFAGLPAPQRRALDVALLRSEPEGEELSHRAVAVGVLGALCGLARTAPLVVGIDDEQWLDAASQRVLAFVLRRLREERIGVLVARRPDAGSGLVAAIEGTSVVPVEHVRLGSLDEGELDRVLRAHLGPGLGRRSSAQLFRSSGGNPLMALEIGRAVLERGDADDGTGMPIPSSLQQVVDERLQRLEPTALDVVQVAGVLSRPSAMVLESMLGPRPAADGLRAAVEAGVLVVNGDRVEFTHPLLAAAAYARLMPADRCSLHARVAASVDDVEERGRHLSLSTNSPDAAVAEVIDSAARRARARGAPDSAAELWAAAARLTPPEQDAEARQRRFEAAECVFEAGDVQRARVLLDEILVGAPPGPARARAHARLGWAIGHLEGFGAGACCFEAGLADVADDVAVEIELEQGLAWSLHSVSGLTAAEPHARRALALAEKTGDQGLIGGSLTHSAFLDSLTGRGLAIDAVARVVECAPAPKWSQILGRPEWIHALLLEWDDNLSEARTRFAALHREALDRGDEQSLPFILFQLARIQLLIGDWGDARRTADDCRDTSVRNGQVSELAYACAIEAIVDAHVGLIDAAMTNISEGIDLADRLGVRPAGLELLATRGFLEFSLTRYEEADRTFRELAAAAGATGLLDPALFRFHGDAIEVKIALGRLDEARALLDDLERLGAPLERAWVVMILGRCGGLLHAAEGDVAAAYDSLGVALATERVGQPFERARTLLALGSVQRRDRKKSDARGSLVAARQVFEQLGAALWAKKAEAELSRVGGRPPAAGLTPTELAVAELIAAGRTYRETAAELFISPKTVQWNLSKVYRKLGIKSRAELPGRLDAG